jgi:hypothetical protein
MMIWKRYIEFLQGIESVKIYGIFAVRDNQIRIVVTPDVPPKDLGRAIADPASEQIQLQRPDW